MADNLLHVAISGLAIAAALLSPRHADRPAGRHAATA
jgi:hypothetical protein